MSIAENISFDNFCLLCTKIQQASSNKKISILQKYIENWKKKAKELKTSQPSIDDSFYPALRFLLPQLDRERGAYGVKEHTLAKIYIRILSLPKDGKDAMKLLNYRVTKSSSSDTGDFAEVAYWVLKKRCAGGGQLSMDDVNNHLNAVAKRHALNESCGVDSELISLLKGTSAEEQKWLIRILLKEMKLGVGQSAILKAFHLDAKDLYDSCNDLKKVCERLKNPEIRLHEIQIEVFSPFKPMLSEECNFQKLDTYLKKSRYFYIETKLDGERFQLHLKEGNFKYFSRNGFDFTSNFGGTRAEGILTSQIADRFHSSVSSCILDGEMMSWNKKKEMFASKGSNVDVKHLKEDSEHQPCFCVFDILLYNDEILTTKPLNYRLEILSRILNPLEGSISFVSRKRISLKDEILDALNEAIDNRDEGVVMKEYLSLYKPNIRTNSGWYKIKPEYVDGLSDTLDLLIIGGYFGARHGNHNITHFLLGVAVNLNDTSKLFYSVGRVGSGYSIKELEELQNKLQPYWNQRVAGVMPPCIEWSKEKPDVWIEPEKSFILEVKATEITVSGFFKAGYTLRFPRVENVRYDKSWKNCLTLEQFKEKREAASGKLTTQHVDEIKTEITPKKHTRSKVAKATHCMSTNMSNIKCISNLLNGKEICVLTGFNEVPKGQVEKKIIEYGGTLVQNAGKSTFCVLAEDDSTIRVKNLIKYESHDCIRTSWFYSQLTTENRHLPAFEPIHFLAMCAQTKKFFFKFYDQYGDHYTNLSTRKSIDFLMSIAENKLQNHYLTKEEKYKMDVELFSCLSPFSLFRLCTAYFDRFPIFEDPTSGLLSDLEISQIDFKFGGGKCLEVINDEITHVIIFSEDLSRLKEIKRKNKERRKKFHIVTEKWITSTLMRKSLARVDEFAL